MLLGGVRDVDFFVTGPRAPLFPARVVGVDFRAVFLEVARGAFLGVAFFLEVFFAVFLLVVFFTAAFLPDDFLLSLRAGRARPADVFLPDVFFLTAVFLRAALGLLDVLLAVFLADVFFAVAFLRPADDFFLPDVFFAGAMAAGR